MTLESKSIFYVHHNWSDRVRARRYLHKMHRMWTLCRCFTCCSVDRNIIWYIRMTHTHVRRRDAQRAVWSHVAEKRAKFNTNVLIAFAWPFSLRSTSFECALEADKITDEEEKNGTESYVFLIFIHLISLCARSAIDQIIMCIARYCVGWRAIDTDQWLNLITCNLTQLRILISVSK